MVSHEKLLAKINPKLPGGTFRDHEIFLEKYYQQMETALRDVVELHEAGKPDYDYCLECGDGRGPYPCATLEAIEKAFG